MSDETDEYIGIAAFLFLFDNLFDLWLMVYGQEGLPMKPNTADVLNLTALQKILTVFLIRPVRHRIDGENELHFLSSTLKYHIFSLLSIVFRKFVDNF